MLYKQLIELFDILDSASASGAQVVEYFRSIVPDCQVETYPLEGPKGHTDMVRILIPGRNGKSKGGSAKTMGILGRLGGLGARPEQLGFVSDGDIARCLSKRRTTYTDPVALIELTNLSSDDFDAKTDKIMSQSVLEIAHRGVISVDIHTDMREVCRVLGENHLKKVPITENGALVGVITLSDIAHYSMSKYLERHGADAQK